MPTYNSNLKDLTTLIGDPALSLSRLEELLECAKTELKGLDEATGELKLENNDTNRPDLWSTEGTARQIRCCHYGKKPHYGFFDTRPQENHRIKVQDTVRAIRPFIGGFMVTGVTVDEPLLIQLIQSQEKLCDNYGRSRDLIAIGVYDASKISLPIHYKGVAPGEIRFAPLDFTEEMSLDEILEQHPKGKEFGHLVTSSPLYPIILDDKGHVLSFPPIINSNDLGCVIEGNDRLFVEVTGKERDAVTLALNILACNLADRGARIAPFAIDYPEGTSLVTPWKFERALTLEMDYVTRYVGEKVELREVIERLEAMDHTLTKNDAQKGLMEWCPAPYRLDCLHPVDIIEDFCISRGYNSFVPEMPEKFTVGMSSALHGFSERLRDLLVGMAFQEVMTYILSSKDTMCTKMGDDERPLEIGNIMSESYSVLRSRLIPILLEIESKNQKAEYPHRFFETGEVARRDDSSIEGTVTSTHAAALIAHGATNFSEIHSILHALMYYLDRDYRLEKIDHPSFIEGRAGSIIVGGASIGIVGEIHPRVLDAWGIFTPCAAFEISLEELMQKTPTREK
jgi:phenylalanyl-tRNA synthetase beta chain